MSRSDSSQRSPTLRRDLRSIVGDGAAFSIMVGVGETYLPAFVLALGLGEVVAGLISTVPILAGGLLQLVSPWAVRSLGSHKRWVVACAVCQSMSLLLMVGMALVTSISPWLIFLPATLYWAGGLATGPAWNAWVEVLVPPAIRATFFARRTQITHVCVLVGLITGGAILATSATGAKVSLFAILFGIAAVGRLYSSAMLLRQSEPVDAHYRDQETVSYRAVWQIMRGGDGMRLVAYLLAVQFAVNIAAPYFTPYMLVRLKLSYLEFMLLIGCGFLGKVLALPLVGRLARRVGAERLLWLGGAGIIPLSALWLVAKTVPALIVVQLVGGLAWASYELAMLLLFFKAIPREHRVAMLSLYNAGNALAMVAGAVVGALIIRFLPDGPGAYLTVFALSSLGRLIAILLIPRFADQPTKLEPPVGLRTVAVRPMAGAIERPILPAAAVPAESV